MRILLMGADGFLGRRIAAALRQAGHVVLPGGRHAGLDFTNRLASADWRPALQSVDVVINAAGIISQRGSQTFERIHALGPQALFRACANIGVRRVVQISALGAEAHAPTPFLLSKWRADETLRTLPLEWFVLRPGLVHGEEGASARLFLRLARLPVIPLIGTGRQAVQPVHAGDLVAAVMRAIDSQSAGQTIDVVGPREMPFAEWLAALRHSAGLPPARVIHLPTRLVRALLPLARPLFPLANDDNLDMLERGCVADPSALIRHLGRPLLDPVTATRVRNDGASSCTAHHGEGLS